MATFHFTHRTGDDCLKYNQELQHIFAIDQFPNNVAVIYDDGENTPMKQSYQQIDAIANCIKSYFQSSEQGEFIGVACSQNIIFPAVLLGIMRSRFGFYNLDLSNLLSDIKFAQLKIAMKYLVVEESILQNTSFKLQSLLQDRIASYINKEESASITLHIFPFKESLGFSPSYNAIHFPFAIHTSGTTGSKKMVLVPNASIVPNVNYFINCAWKMDSKDVVFGTSPVTFDPSIIELFTALGSGAAVLYVPQRVKLIGEVLAKILVRHQVSVLQITPSLFRRIEKNLISEEMFSHEKSSLEVLAFGGEKCIDKCELRKIIDTSMFNKLCQRGLQNLYGITEMSCWASVENIDLNSECDITIGKPIVNTCIHMDNNGNIFIGSDSRTCTILDSNGDQVAYKIQDGIKFFDTGDIGVLNKDNTGIVYATRKDRIIKRNGYKTSLVEIENSAMATDLVSTAACVFYNDKIYLVIQLIAASSGYLTSAQRVKREFLPKLKLDIPPQIFPDVIVPVEEIPVTQNGKINMDRILSVAEFQNAYHQKDCAQKQPAFVNFKFQKECFLKALKTIWDMCTNHPKIPNKSYNFIEKGLGDLRFIEAGGDSISAVRFIEEAFTYLNLFGSKAHTKYEKEVFRLLILEDFEKVANFLCEIGERHPVDISVVPIKDTENDRNVQQSLSAKYSSDIGSYPLLLISESVSAQNPLRTECFRKRRHENKRSLSVSAKIPPEIIFSCAYDLRMCVDSSASVITGLNFVNGPIAIMGSHSGYAIAVSLVSHISKNSPRINGFQTQWEIQLGGRIEATTAVHPNLLSVYIGTHNKRLYSLNTLTGHINWRYECKDSVRAAAVLSSNGNELIFVDENTLYCLNPHNAELIWRRTGLRHISTCSPAINELSIFVVTATNKVEAINIITGDKRWTRKGKFSNMSAAYCTAPVLFVTKSCYPQLLLVGTRNGCIDALDQETGEIVWTCSDLQVSTFSPNTVPFSPITHKFCDICDCDNALIVFLNRMGKGIVITPEGTVLRSIELDLEISAPPCFMCCNESNQCLETSVEASIKHSKMCNKYLVFYAEGVLKFVDIETPSLKYDVKTDFDTKALNFSQPIVCNNYVLVGGRDNKLHIFQLASINC